jgi:hypothetical protein
MKFLDTCIPYTAASDAYIQSMTGYFLINIIVLAAGWRVELFR